MIQHLVISGGGPLGIQYFGALKTLAQQNYWHIENIQSIYGTSVGALIACIIALRHDWDILTEYIINRPWECVFTPDISILYNNKGLFNAHVFRQIMHPLMNAKDVDNEITLLQFFQHTHIDLHLFTFDINQFQTVDLSHKTRPHLKLITAIAMSCALPGVFCPIINDDEGTCFIDGGVMSNCPINYCIDSLPNKEEEEEKSILVIKPKYNYEGAGENTRIVQNSSVFDYISCMALNSMNYIRKSVVTASLPETTVLCEIDENPLTIEFMQAAIHDRKVREQLMLQGQKDAMQYLLQKETA
jgi:patatin-like phospholipase/acyl hydrolase